MSRGFSPSDDIRHLDEDADESFDETSDDPDLDEDFDEDFETLDDADLEIDDEPDPDDGDFWLDPDDAEDPWN